MPTSSYVKNPRTQRLIRVGGPTYQRLARDGVRVAQLKRHRRARPIYSRTVVPDGVVTLAFTLPFGAPTGRKEKRVDFASTVTLGDVLQNADALYRSILLVDQSAHLLGSSHALNTPIGKVLKPGQTHVVKVMPMGDAVKGSQYALLIKYLKAGYTKKATPETKTTTPSALEETPLAKQVVLLKAQHPTWSFLRVLKEAQKRVVS